MSYITETDVAIYLGVTVTALQQSEVDAIMPGFEHETEVFTNRK